MANEITLQDQGFLDGREYTQLTRQIQGYWPSICQDFTGDEPIKDAQVRKGLIAYHMDQLNCIEASLGVLHTKYEKVAGPIDHTNKQIGQLRQKLNELEAELK